VRVLASSYGSRPDEVTFYLLDGDMNILAEIPSESRIRERGTMKWYVFHAPSVEVPETFHVAFQLNSHQRGGTYVATRRVADGESGHSFTRGSDSSLTPLVVDGTAYDWMIRAYLAKTPNMEARQREELRKKQEAAEAVIRAKGRGWGPEQATGKPDAYENAVGGDFQSAWASKTEDGQAEWLELTYDNVVTAIGVDVYETFKPGAVNKVTVFDGEGNEQTAWEGADPTPVGIAGGKGVSKIRFAKPVKTRRVRIHIDSAKVAGWNEIDAVGMVESETAVHWATSATASSTYAE